MRKLATVLHTNIDMRDPVAPESGRPITIALSVAILHFAAVRYLLLAIGAG